MNLKQKFMNWIVPDLTTPRGNYHATLFTTDDRPYKLFLMVDGQGLGTLVINASTIVNLNQTSTDMVYHYIQGASLEGITRFITKKYTNSKESAGTDFEKLLGEIEGLLSVEDQSPTSQMNGDQGEPQFVNDRFAILALDPVTGSPTPDLTFWKKRIDELVAEGFPKIHFVTNQMLAYPGLEELVAYTEEIGVVCSLVSVVTEGDQERIAKLLRVGLDHLILLPMADHETTPGTMRWLTEQDIYFEVHLEVKDLIVDPKKIVEELLTLGVKHFNMSEAFDRIGFDQLRDMITKAGGTLRSGPLPHKLDSANLTRSEIGNVVLADGLRYFG